MKRILVSFFIIVVLLAVTALVIAYGRGYRFDLNQKKLSSTGLLVATSEPNGAEIFLDGKLKSATNTTLTLSPGWYQVKIVKEGYLPWEKRMRVQGEVVSETKAILFPTTPAFSPLTNSGVVASTLSPDKTKVAYALPLSSSKAGLWVLNLVSQPLGFSQDAISIAKSSASLDFALGTFLWSPNSKQILITIGASYYLVEVEKNGQPTFLSLEAWKKLEADWQEEAKLKEEEKLAVLPPEFAKIATESSRIISFAPDDTKILYQATASAVLPQILKPAPIATNPTEEERKLKTGAFYVYDLKEDKNFEIELEPNTNTSLSWFPTSRHLVMVETDRISILEYDGSNKAAIYSGPFEKFIASFPGGGKLLITTSYNRPDHQAGNLPNLYAINLR